MGKHSAFDQDAIEVHATPQTEGLLDQLNLPPGVTDFLRRNQRSIWTVVIVVTLSVTGFALYDSYRAYRTTRAVAALDVAMNAEGDQKVEKLRQVIEQYGPTPSAMWAKVELAHFSHNNGNISEAVKILQEVNAGLSADDPAKALVLFNLGGLYEQNKKFDEALAVYRELSTIQGFEADASRAMGRVYEMMKNRDGAIEMYKKYLTLTEVDGGKSASDPERQLVLARLKRLQS